MKSLQHPIHTPLLQYFSTDFPWILTLSISLLSIECTLPRTLHIPGSLQVKNWKLIYHDENCQHPKLRGQYLYRIYTTHFPTISHGKYHHIVIQSFYIMVCVLESCFENGYCFIEVIESIQIIQYWFVMSARTHVYMWCIYTFTIFTSTTFTCSFALTLHLHLHLHLLHVHTACTFTFTFWCAFTFTAFIFTFKSFTLHCSLYIYIYVCVYVCVYPVHYLIFLGFQFQSSCFLPVLHHGPWRFSVLSFLPPSASSILFPHARAATDVLATSTAEYFSKTQRQDSTAATTLSHSNSRTI